VSLAPRRLAFSSRAKRVERRRATEPSYVVRVDELDTADQAREHVTVTSDDRRNAIQRAFGAERATGGQRDSR
jgi:hypothetical protein